MWNGVGGKLEPGEEPFTACIREVAEETGLRIERPVLRALLVVTVRTTGALWVIFVFTAVAPFSRLRASDEGELAWIKIPDLPSVAAPPDLAVVIPRLFEDREVLTVRVEYETEDPAAGARVQLLGL